MAVFIARIPDLFEADFLRDDERVASEPIYDFRHHFCISEVFMAGSFNTKFGSKLPLVVIGCIAVIDVAPRLRHLDITVAASSVED